MSCFQYESPVTLCWHCFQRILLSLWECLWGTVMIVNWGVKTHPECGLCHFMSWALNCIQVEKAYLCSKQGGMHLSLFALNWGCNVTSCWNSFLDLPGMMNCKIRMANQINLSSPKLIFIRVFVTVIDMNLEHKPMDTTLDQTTVFYRTPATHTVFLSHSKARHKAGRTAESQSTQTKEQIQGDSKLLTELQAPLLS